MSGSLCACFGTDRKDSLKFYNGYPIDTFGSLMITQVGACMFLAEMIEKASKHLFAAMDALVVITGPAGEIHFMNSSAERILGWKFDEVEGKRFDSLLNLDFDPGEAGDSPTWSGKGEILLRSGIAIPSEFLVSFLPGDDGSIHGMIILNHLSRPPESAAVDEDEMISEQVPTSTLAHGLRNPLGGISGYASLLNRKIETGDPRKRLAGRIIDGVNSLDRMISDLLDFTRISRPSFEPVPIWNLLEETLAYANSETGFKENGIELQLENSDSHAVVLADQYQLHNLFMHLIRNAVQAMPDGGFLKVGIFMNKTGEDADVPGRRDYVSIEISAAGSGMEEIVKNRIFEVFYTTKDNSSGMGLAIAHRIVSCHGGYIDVESSPGSGTAVTVALPSA